MKIYNLFSLFQKPQQLSHATLLQLIRQLWADFEDILGHGVNALNDKQQQEGNNVIIKEIQIEEKSKTNIYLKKSIQNVYPN